MNESRLPVLHVEGSWEEMGRSLARQSLGEGGRGLMEWYTGLLARLVDDAPGSGRKMGIPRRLQDLSLRTLSLLNRGRMDPDIALLSGILAEETSLGFNRGQELLYLPDLVHLVSGLLERSFPPPACSGFFASGVATVDGRMIVGRNFDFYGREWWNAHQAVIVFHPDKGQQSFLWVGTLGLPFGHFGINAAGIGLAMFTNFTKDLSPLGAPLFSIAHSVLARAESLDEAIRIASHHPRLAGFSFLIVDTRAREARILGMSARKQEILSPREGALIRTNHYTSAAMSALDSAPLPWARHSRARAQRLHELLVEHRGQLRVQDVPSLLSDTLDPGEGRHRVVGDILAATNNAASLVWSPQDDALYVATGRFPVCHAETWQAVRPRALLAGQSAEPPPDLAGGGALTSNARLALESYEEAWSAFAERHDAEQAINHLLGAARLLPDEAVFSFLAGVILVTKGEQGQAIPMLRRAAEAGWRDRDRAAEAWLWLGRALDLGKRRPEALEAYAQVERIGESAFSGLARKHRLRPCRRAEVGRARVEIVLASVMMPLR